MMNKLMKKIAIALTAATLTLTAASTAFANDGYQRTCPINITDTYEIRYTIAEDGLNIRSDANANAPVLGNLPYGTCVTVTGYVELGYAGNYVNWVQVSVNGMTGFVSTDYLSTTQPVQKQYAYASGITSDGQIQTNNAGTPEYVKTAANQATKEQYTVNVNGYLALRSDPAFNYGNEIGQLHTGDVVNFKENYGTYWCVYVPATGMLGFVNSNYLV